MRTTSLSVLVLLLACLPARAGDAPQAAPAARRVYVPPSPEAREVRAAQRILDPRHRRGRVLEEVARELAGIGPDAAPVFVAMLTGALEVTDYGAGGLTLEELGPEIAHDDVLLVEALRRLPPAKVADAVGSACGADAALDLRLVGLRVLGDLGLSEGIGAWVEIATGIEEIHLRRAYVRAPLESALGHSLARSASGFARLARHLRTLERPLLPCVARAAGLSERREAVELVLGLLGRDRELDLVVLECLPDLARRTVGGLGENSLAWLRPLLSDEDARMRAAAANALAELADPGAVPGLLQLLTDEQPLVQHAALRALQRLAGQELPADREAWEAWHAAELRWNEGPARAAAAALASPDAAVAVEAARELTAHRLFRHESALALAAALERPELEVVQGFCVALASLGSMGASDELLGLLARTDEGLRAAAHLALVALTGRKLPPEPEAWLQALRG